MAEAAIPVDLFNPGQVFACLGFAEAADVLLGGARGSFDWRENTHVLFRIEANGDSSPVEHVLAFLASAEVRSLAPSLGDSETLLSTEKWSVATTRLHRDAPFPMSPPSSSATLPAHLSTPDSPGSPQLVIDHWGDATQRDNVKFWAGSGGYPGAALVRDALELMRAGAASAVADPFALCAPQSSSFRFDWRRDYVPLGIGFSLNNHTKMVPQGYPVVELMAAIGLSHARPQRPERRNKLSYRYTVLGGDLLPLSLLRAGLGGGPLPFPQRTFRMTLDWPGQEGQARCITDVVEET